MIEHALYYARQGFYVYPLWGIDEKGECRCNNVPCSSSGKHPMWHRDYFPHGLRSATRDKEIIQSFWSLYPEANIALAAGSLSNLYVLDIDIKRCDGLGNLKKAISIQELKNIPYVQTGSGGYHFYFKDERSFGHCNLLDGVELLGEGCGVVAPPSRYKGNKKYEWVKRITETSMGLLPDCLIELIKKSSSQKPVKSMEWDAIVWEGNPGRNNFLAQAAGRFYGVEGLDFDSGLKQLLEKNGMQCVPPLEEKEVFTIARSIYKKEMSKREEAPEELPKEAPSKGVLEVISLDSYLLKQGKEEVTWVIDGWLPAATTGLVVAPPESYKTWLTMDMVYSIASGSPFLGKYPVLEQGPVIYIQQEDSHQVLASRWSTIMKVGKINEIKPDVWEVPFLPRDVPIYIHEDRNLFLKDKESLRELDKQIEKIRPILVVIDPFYSIATLDEYGTKSITDMMVFKKLRDTYGCSFLIVHHMSKAASRKTTEEDFVRNRDKGWGSQFLNGWQETGIEMLPTKDDLTKVMIDRHTKIAERPPLIVAKFNIETYNYGVEIEDYHSESEGVSFNKEKLREFLRTTKTGDINDLLPYLPVNGIAEAIRTLPHLGVRLVKGFYTMEAR